MNHQLIASHTVVINASPAKVWKVLTDPKLIAEYLFGTETITNWKVGRKIIFQGEYQGYKYQDKGLVLENKPNEILSYRYWAQYSGLEDKLENYSIVTYTLEQKDNNTTTFTWTQKGFPDEERQKHSQGGLGEMLEQIKTIAER